MKFSRRAILAASLSAPLVAKAALSVNFGLNWLPQPEMGGFFEAKAKGFYDAAGLDVHFILGGPQVNNRLALINGQIDFYLGGNLFQAFSALENNVPTVAIGAFFNKDPQAIMAHPQSAKSFAELKERPIFISKIGLATFFPWLKAEHGFKDENVKPYLFNTQGFLADKLSLCQAYVTSEPFAVEQASGIKPDVYLLHDYGFITPSNLIEVKREMDLDKRNRFMQASRQGWESYMQDGAQGNALLTSLNPEITPTKIAYAKRQMSERQIVGNGSISQSIINNFYAKMEKAGALKAGLDPLKVYEAL